MAAIRARYERHDGLPMNSLVNVVKGAGCTVSPSRMRLVNYEVNHGGICIGTICAGAAGAELELSRRETPRNIMEMVGRGVERERTRSAAVASQMARTMASSL